jgi:hypothetical protein
MHEECLYEFENDINYDEDNGKVEDTYYCPLHHPKKKYIRNDDSDSDSDSEDDEGQGEGGNKAATKIS